MDIVIPLKRSIQNEELRYTIRSICKNMPHRKIWLAGYSPKWLYGIGYIKVQVPYGSKYKKAAANILAACRDPRVSDDFLLFNDDFFVMQPITDFQNLHRGPLIDHLKRLEKDYAAKPYYEGMKRTYDILRRMGFENPVNYGLHIPMIINKKKWLEAWEMQEEYNPKRLPLHLRTFYGNVFQVGGEQIDDVKLAKLTEIPSGEELFLSSNDNSFAIGNIGDYVRSKFYQPCKYESNDKKPIVLK
jgi:hypothetical protein